MTFKNDELMDENWYVDQKYHLLIKRCGASQDDIDEIEE
jgi:hypothetical protein